MDPNLVYHVAINSTNESLIPIAINFTPLVNVTVIQPIQSIGQILLQSGGTFLAGVIALISFMWLNLRGAKVICSPIRDLAFFCAPGGSGIIPKFILSNVGGSSAVIEYIAIELLRIAPNQAKYRFTAGYDGSIQNLAEKNTREGKHGEFTNLDNPVSPFIIEKGDAIVKEITFMHTPQFDYIKGEYILKLLLMQQSYRGFWTRILVRGKKKEKAVLEQKVHMDVGLSYKGDGMMQFKKTQVLDPKTDELSL